MDVVADDGEAYALNEHRGCPGAKTVVVDLFKAVLPPWDVLEELATTR